MRRILSGKSWPDVYIPAEIAIVGSRAAGVAMKKYLVARLFISDHLPHIRSAESCRKAGIRESDWSLANLIS